MSNRKEAPRLMSWDPRTAEAIEHSNDLHVSPFREDGTTYGTPTWVYAVVVDGDVYVRAYHGTASRWYHAAVAQRAGRIQAAGSAYEVEFEPVSDEKLNDRVDDAYRHKYAGDSYLDQMIDATRRAATVRITPRQG